MARRMARQAEEADCTLVKRVGLDGSILRVLLALALLSGRCVASEEVFATSPGPLSAKVAGPEPGFVRSEVGYPGGLQASVDPKGLNLRPQNLTSFGSDCVGVPH